MFSVFGYVYLADEKILARKYGFFKAAAAHAQALVNDGCAAAEAAGGLYLHLLLGEGTTQILEGLLCFLGRAVGGMLSVSKPATEMPAVAVFIAL